MASSASSSSSTGRASNTLTLADRATLGNMCPEYGATIAIFPIDEMTLDYLRLTGRDASRIALVEAYAKAQGLFLERGAPDPIYSETIEIDLGCGRAVPGGAEAPAGSRAAEERQAGVRRGVAGDDGHEDRGRVRRRRSRRRGRRSNTARSSSRRSRAARTRRIPSVMIGAGLLAKKAVEKGLTRKPWVKTSLAPGSKVVTDYLKQAGLDAVPRPARVQPGRATAAPRASATAGRCPRTCRPRSTRGIWSSPRC